MALTPCKFHLSDGKVLSFAEAKQYLFDNPDLMEIPVVKEKPQQKSQPKNEPTKIFETVDVLDYSTPEKNKFRPNEQLKFNQGDYYEPVTIIADPEAIELISQGAKENAAVAGKRAYPERGPRVEMLEKKYGISAQQANKKAKQIAKDVRGSDAVFAVIGGYKSKTGETQKVISERTAKQAEAPSPKEKLAAAHEKWKASQNKQGIIFDPKSQAENDIEFLKAILSYIKEEAITTYENFKKALKEFGVYDESKDEDWRAVFDKTQPEGADPKAKGQKALATRAATGTAPQDIRDAIKENGLEYDVQSFDEAEADADAFIKQVGLEAALRSVGKVADAPAAVIYIRAIDDIKARLESATDQDEVAELFQQQLDLIKELDKKARDAGRFNSYLQRGYQKSDFGYSFDAQVEKFKKVNKGEIDAETIAKFKEWEKIINDSRLKIEQLEKEKQAILEQRAVANIAEDATRSTPLNIKQKADRLANQVLKAQMARPRYINSSSPAALMWDGAVKLTAESIRAGGTVAQAIADGIEAIKKSDWYKSQTKAIQDLVEKDFKAQIKSETNRQITIDEKGKINISSAFLKDAYNNGNTTIESLTQAVMDELIEDNPTITERQVRDAITKYGQKANPTRDEVLKEIQKQKTIGSLLSQIEDAENGIKKATNDKSKKALSEREKSLRKRLKALTGEETRLANAKERAREKLKALENRLKDGDFSKKKQEPLAIDKELESLQADVSQAQERFDRAQYENEVANRTSWQRAADFVFESTKLMQGLNATLEFSFIGIQGANLVTSNLWTKQGRQNLKKAFANMWNNFKSEESAERWYAKMKTQPWFATAKAAGVAFTEQHARLTVKEELFVMGWANKIWEVLGKPIEWVAGKKAFDNWKKQNPMVALERAASGLMNTLRAERFIQAQQMLEMEGKTFKDYPEAYKQAADVINMLTSAPRITTDENIAKGLSAFFYSPKNFVAVMTNSTPIAFVYYGKKRAGADNWYKPTVAQKIAVTDLMRMTVTNLAGLGLWALAGSLSDDDEDEKMKVDYDPRSTTFLQYKKGKLTVDPWHGHRPWWIFQTRIMLEALNAIGVTKIDPYKSARTGETSRLGQGTIPKGSDLIAAQITNKLAPFPGLIYDFYSGRTDADGNRVNQIGEPYTFQREVIDRTVPMFLTTMIDVAKSEPDLVQAFIASTAVVGYGVNTQKEPEKTQSEKTGAKFKDPDEEQRKVIKEELKKALKNNNLSAVKKAYSKLGSKAKLDALEIFGEIESKKIKTYLGDEINHILVKQLIVNGRPIENVLVGDKAKNVNMLNADDIKLLKFEFNKLKSEQIQQARLLDKASGMDTFEAQIRNQWK